MQRQHRTLLPPQQLELFRAQVCGVLLHPWQLARSLLVVAVVVETQTLVA
jgi:hypothetical protein